MSHSLLSHTGTYLLYQGCSKCGSKADSALWLISLGAVSIRSYARKNLLKPTYKQESVTFMPPNKEVKINNIKPFPVNWT